MLEGVKLVSKSMHAHKEVSCWENITHSKSVFYLIRFKCYGGFVYYYLFISRLRALKFEVVGKSLYIHW